MRPFHARRLAAAAALTFAVVNASAEAPFSFAATAGKLPKDVIPIQYAAHLATQASTDEERTRFARALTVARDPALAARTLALAIAPATPPGIAVNLAPGVARSEHQDLAWNFAVANREALMKDQEANGQNRVFPSLVSSSSSVAHAAMMEDYVRENFGPDAQVEAQRVANGIRTRAAQKARLLPQVRAALQ